MMEKGNAFSLQTVEEKPPLQDKLLTVEDERLRIPRYYHPQYYTLISPFPPHFLNADWNTLLDQLTSISFQGHLSQRFLVDIP